MSSSSTPARRSFPLGDGIRFALVGALLAFAGYLGAVHLGTRTERVRSAQAISTASLAEKQVALERLERRMEAFLDAREAADAHSRPERRVPGLDLPYEWPAKDGMEAASNVPAWELLAIAALFVAVRRRGKTIEPAGSVEQRKWASTMAILQAMVDSSVDGILIVDAAGKILLKNRRMAEIWGIPHEIFASNDDSRLIQAVVGSVRDPDRFLAAVQHLYADPLATQRDEIELKNGRVIDRHTGPAIGPDGAVHGRVWNFRDVTERIEAQKKLEEANHALSDLATVDALTGLKNRRAFDETSERAFLEATRSDRPLSVLMLDVDHFKSVNDRFGHDAGDAALREVARTIAQETRDEGFAARYGGEEFAALLPGFDETGAAVVAERIRTAIEAIAFGHGALTVSVGVASYAGGDGSAAEIVHRADRALYAAKSAGRNQISSWGRQTPVERAIGSLGKERRAA